MTIAFDAVTESDRAGSAGDPHAFDHTPSGTPRGVVVLITQDDNDDQVSGVTYGGETLARIQYQDDITGEPMAAWLYFLGTGIPTGTQSVSVDLTLNTTDALHFTCVTFTASDDTEVVDSDGYGDPNIQSPSVTLSYAGRTCLTVGALNSGINTTANITELSGMTRMHDSQFGSTLMNSIHSRQTSPGTSDFTFGYTTTVSDDVAMVAAAISQVASPDTDVDAELASSTGASNAAAVSLAPEAGTGAATGLARDAIAVGGAYALEVLADSPSLYYRHGEASGTTARDVLGANDGTYTGSVTLGVAGALVGDNDTAFTIDAAGEYVVSTTFDIPTAAITLEAWIKGTFASGDSAVLGQWDGNGAVLYYDVGVGGGTFRLFINGNSVAWTGANATLVTGGAWHHVAGTWDGTDGRIFADGALVAGPTSLAGPITLAATDFLVGQYGDASHLSFGGSIDEAAVYPTAVSGARLLAHFNTATGAGGTDVDAGHASATGAASIASAAIGPNVGTASASGAAQGVTAVGTADAGVATATAAAGVATVNVAPNAGAASATGQAYDATAQTVTDVEADAELATATGAANQPSTAIATSGGTAAGSGAANGVVGSLSSSAGAASGTGAAGAGAGSVGLSGGDASASGTASGPSSALSTSGGHASASGAAHDPSINTSSSAQAVAGHAAASGAANGPSASIAPNAGNAAATGASLDATVTTAKEAAAGLAEGSGQAHGAAGSVAPAAGMAAALADALGPLAVIAPNADLAAGSGAANGASLALTTGAGHATATGLARDARQALIPTDNDTLVVIAGRPTANLTIPGLAASVSVPTRRRATVTVPELVGAVSVPSRPTAQVED